MLLRPSRLDSVHLNRDAQGVTGTSSNNLLLINDIPLRKMDNVEEKHHVFSTDDGTSRSIMIYQIPPGTTARDVQSVFDVSQRSNLSKVTVLT